jgi:hypothetical protein
MSADPEKPADIAPRRIRHAQADADSDTRFGPHPVPPDHRRPHDPPDARPIPPHGPVSPDGRRPWPQPSRGAKWLVWGGTALAAAALTAGTAIAARQAIQALSAEKDRLEPHPGPSIARSADAKARGGRQPKNAKSVSGSIASGREATGHKAPGQKGTGQKETGQNARHADTGPRRPAPRPGLIQEIEANTASLSGSIENVMLALTAGVTGFRTLVRQAGTIMREFGHITEQAQDFLDRSRPSQPQDRPLRGDKASPESGRDAGTSPGRRTAPRDRDTDAAQKDDPRMHRL